MANKSRQSTVIVIGEMEWYPSGTPLEEVITSMSNQTAKSAAMAGTARRLRRCSRQAATSVASATASRAAVSGTSSRVAIMSATAVMTVDKVAIHGISWRLRCHARANASTTNATSTTAANAGARTWKRTVDSQSSGARISAAVTA